MKAQEVIKRLAELDPNEDIIMDYYIKSDFDHMFDEEGSTPLSNDEWKSVGYRADKHLAWYSDVEELVSDVVSERE